jgi:hypothetical protein
MLTLREEKEVTSRSTTAILTLSQKAKEGKVLGVGMCVMLPSGCFDIAKGISQQFADVPFIRVKVDQGMGPKFVDYPRRNPECDTVFFTGCALSLETMVPVLSGLSQFYYFTQIKYVYGICPPHHATDQEVQEYHSKDTEQFFSQMGIQYKLLFSGIDAKFSTNIGIPRYEFKDSSFEVPPECYGVLRHRHVNDFLPAGTSRVCSPYTEKYLKEFFRQVAVAGKKCKNPVMVIALGIGEAYRQRLSELAQERSIVIDFCDSFPGNRLPNQEDFFKLLAAMQEKNGVVSLDRSSTQSLLQALSLHAPVMMYAQRTHDSLHLDFYEQLVNFVPKKFKPTAEVILGLTDVYKLFKKNTACKTVYRLLNMEMAKAHQKFEAFRDGVTQSVEEKVERPINSASSNSSAFWSRPEKGSAEAKPKASGKKNVLSQLLRYF